MTRMRFNSVPTLKRKSIAYFRSDERVLKNDPWISLYGHMFIDDVRLYVMPIGGKSRARPDFSIEIAPDDPTARRIITYAFARRDHYYYPDITETVSHFIEETASALAYRGVVCYEIAKGEWPTEAVEPEEMKIESKATSEAVFSPRRIPGRVTRLANYYLQIIPPTEWARIGKKIAVIPASDVWSLQIPPELGGPRRHRRLLKTLVRASSPLPEFVSNAMKGLSEIQDFSFSDFHKQQLLAVASESARWGWKARDLWMDHTLEYFRIYRHLRFALSMAILREYIVNSMNDLLQRVSFPSSLILRGLPTASEVKSYLAKMEKGEMSFDDVWRAIEI
jgi:hypothetical protein